MEYFEENTELICKIFSSSITNVSKGSWTRSSGDILFGHFSWIEGSYSVTGPYLFSWNALLNLYGVLLQCIFCSLDFPTYHSLEICRTFSATVVFLFVISPDSGKIIMSQIQNGWKKSINIPQQRELEIFGQEEVAHKGQKLMLERVKIFGI